MLHPACGPFGARLWVRYQGLLQQWPLCRGYLARAGLVFNIQRFTGCPDREASAQQLQCDQAQGVKIRLHTGAARDIRFGGFITGSDTFIRASGCLQRCQACETEQFDTALAIDKNLRRAQATMGLAQCLIPCIQGLCQLAEQCALLGGREFGSLAALEQPGQREAIDSFMGAEQPSALIKEVAIAGEHMGMVQSLAQQYLFLECIDERSVALQVRGN